MSAIAIASVVMLAVSLILILASGVPVAIRAQRAQRRARKLGQHPTLIALRSLETSMEQLRGLQPRIEEIRARSARIAQDAVELAATSGALGLQVDRVAFATRLLLSTFVPTLRGSMAD